MGSWVGCLEGALESQVLDQRGTVGLNQSPQGVVQDLVNARNTGC